MNFGKSIQLFFAAILVSLTLPVTAHSAEKVKVSATFSILGDMVKRVGGQYVAVTTLVGPDGDTHVYRPTPADAKAMSKSDLLVVNGLEFEGWLDRLVEASNFKGRRVVATKGIDAIPYEEGEGHGGHTFEWAGVFDLSPGTYKWSFAKVDGKYAVPVMKMVIFKSGRIEESEEKAEGLLESKDSDAKRNNDVLVAQDKAYALNFDATKKMTAFTVNITKAGKYAFFTEHMPFEFEADEHFFKDISGKDVEPIAQEPDTGHHGHDDHAKNKHGEHDKDKHDEHAGHNHGAFDPHAWQSLANAVIYVNNVTAALAQISPDNAVTFYKNRAAYIAEIEELDKQIREKIAGLPLDGRTVVTAHDAFQYFGRDYGLTFLAPQGLSTDSEASAQDVANLIKQMRAKHISAVFVENITDPRLITQVAKETGATVGGTLYPGALSGPNGPASTYLKMMRHNATMLTRALGS